MIFNFLFFFFFFSLEWCSNKLQELLPGDGNFYTQLKLTDCYPSHGLLYASAVCIINKIFVVDYT